MDVAVARQKQSFERSRLAAMQEQRLVNQVANQQQEQPTSRAARAQSAANAGQRYRYRQATGSIKPRILKKAYQKRIKALDAAITNKQMEANQVFIMTRTQGIPAAVIGCFKLLAFIDGGLISGPLGVFVGFLTRVAWFVKQPPNLKKWLLKPARIVPVAILNIISAIPIIGWLVPGDFLSSIITPIQSFLYRRKLKRRIRAMKRERKELKQKLKALKYRKQ